MNILAIESTEAVGSVAALVGSKLLLQLDLDPDKRSAQTLAPSIQALLERVGWRPADVKLVAVTIGPGSFTSLRVGVTTAKTLAYCVGAEILGVDTLESIAEAAPAEVLRLSAAVDAQRGQVVAATFLRPQPGPWTVAEPSRLMDAEAWLGSLEPGTCLAGPVLRNLRAQVPAHLNVLEPIYWRATAAAVGQVAWRRYAAGDRADVWSLLPCYFRRSAAEEKADRRQPTAEIPDR